MNPKKIFWSVSIMLATSFLSCASLAEDQESVFMIGKTTEGSDLSVSVTNGHAWKVLPRQAKITFIIGLEEGWLLVLMQTKEGGGQNINALWESARGNSMGLMGSEIAKQVDSFYSDSANIRVPIVEAYRYIHQKVKGATPEELARLAAKLRQTYKK